MKTLNQIDGVFERPGITEFEIARSKAVKPLYYQAPYPEWGRYKPRDFQHAAVEYALRREHCIIGDAPGVGKSAESILLSNAIGAKKTLVICPAALRLNWEREVWMWSTIPKVKTFCVLTGKGGVDLNADYVIASYNIIQNKDILRAICSQKWDHMIFDEAHKVKEFKGNITTRIVGGNLVPLAGRVTFATGTLLPNQPNECYNAMRLLDWESIDCASHETFTNFYYAKGGGMVRKSFHNPVTGRAESRLVFSQDVRNVPINLDHLRHRLRSRLMIRRLKEDILHELPDKQWHLVPVAVSSEMKKLMRHEGWKRAQRLYELDPEAFDGGVPIDGAIATARRIMGEAKAPEVANYAAELLRSGTNKIVIGAWHKSVMEFLRGKLEKYGLVYMDGSTSPTAKQQAVDDFQRKPDIRIILGQAMPLGEGWTLTAAQDVINAEPDWCPGRSEQLFDRVHRQGQTGGSVTCHCPIIPGTLDEKIMSRIARKSITIHAALDEED